MKKTKLLLLVAVSITFVTLSNAQHKRYVIKNGFALGGGLTQFDILTDNFNTTAGNGWLIHASATADIPHKWYNISYGMQLSENNIEFAGAELVNNTQSEMQVEYKLFAAQLSMLFHAKVIKNLLTVDFGPMLQYNGKLELQTESDHILTVGLKDSNMAIEAFRLEDISQFNVNGAIGATLGFQFIKLRAQYIYGFTNMFGKLNDQDFAQVLDKFKGNQSMITFAALITF